MTRTCGTCDFGRVIDRSDWPSAKLRCMRDRTMRDGHVVHHNEVGVSTDFETDSIYESHRVAGDKCGPGRRHWKEKS